MSQQKRWLRGLNGQQNAEQIGAFIFCLLSNSDAADEEDHVALVGRRISKNKTVYAWI